MLELSRAGHEWRLGFAGDTFNTALALCQLGAPVAYLTALGDDAFSQEMRAAWAREGLDTSLVLTDPDRLPGLYAIRTDATGERSFFYWRQHSAVRRLFALAGIDAALDRVRSAELLYLSGITLSLFAGDEQLRWVQLARETRDRGGHVAFDPNYRPAGWSDLHTARNVIRALAPHVSIALPTFDDERALFSDPTPQATVDRWRSWGVDEVIVKLGAKGCLSAMGAARAYVASECSVAAIDTSGAGDAFNAAYIAARRRGRAPVDAARFGNALGAAAVQHTGALLPREDVTRLATLMESAG